MYYNRILGRVIFDAVDYFLLSTIASIYLSQYLQSYFSDRQKIKRLAQDLINQSKLSKEELENIKMRLLCQDIINQSKMIKSSSDITTSYSSKRAEKIFRLVSKVVYGIRGGSKEFLYKLYTSSERIKTFVIYFLAFLSKKKSANEILELILSGMRLYLQLILFLFKIKVYYCSDSVTGQVKIVAVVAGSFTGITLSWLGVGTTLFAHVLGLVWFGRNFVQQLIYDRQYRIYEMVRSKLLEDEEFMARIVNEIKDKQSKVQPLNWETNPALKEAAESLGIFDKKPGPIKSTEPYLYDRYLKNKNLPKIEENEVDLGIIDVDFVPEEPPTNIPSRLRIKD